MYRKVLVPMALDHDISPGALEIAAALAAEGATIEALHVYEAPQGSVSAYLDERVVKAGFEQARARLNQKLAGAPGVIPVLRQGHGARTILDYAAANGVDCIVIGSHRPGLSDYFLGSTSARVVRHAACAVHVHRP